jgi:hypothetical protein
LEYEDDDEADDFRDDDVDLDMLPTMLVYRSGDLVHNWVRVDWEAGDAGLEEFLEKSVLLRDFFCVCDCLRRFSQAPRPAPFTDLSAIPYA